ncbi:hypothetical protein HMPREF9963_0704 [Streptococcus dysgalactiae subsp. equisimilis SK1250]|nr:hypothetical protein HMPREF9963_0704 [Streptococcus dysgalactiae subsp. equisimilis SK1250]
MPSKSSIMKNNNFEASRLFLQSEKRVLNIFFFNLNHFVQKDEED